MSSNSSSRPKSQLPQNLFNTESHLGTEPINKLFWKYSIPAILAMLINGAYALIDGLFIGHAIGTEGLTAINFTWPLVGLITGLGIMIGIGAGTEMSVERGKNNWPNAGTIVSNAILLIAITGLAVSSITIPFQSQILRLLGVLGYVETLANEYTHILLLNAVTMLAGAALPLILRNDDRPHLTTVLMCTGALLNILLDWLFVIIFDLGMAGAAVATVLSQSVIGTWALLYFVSKKTKLHISLTKIIQPEWPIALKILTTGMPSLFIFFYYAFLVAIHNIAFLKYGGITAVAAFTIVSYVQNAYYLIAEGVSTGVQPIISYNAGARCFERIKRTIKMGMVSILVFGIITLLIVNLFPLEIAYLFNKNDSNLAQHTAVGLHLHLITLFLDGGIVLAGAYFQSISKIRISLFISISNLLIVVPFLAILPKFIGINGVWLALPLSNIILATVVGWILVKDLKAYPKKKGIN